MDASQLRELRDWAERLVEQGASDETRAAGRAIVLLVAEVDAVQAAVAAAGPAPSSVSTEAGEEDGGDGEPRDEGPPAASGGGLRDRLRWAPGSSR